MKIAVACDHGGLNLKKEIVKHLNSKGYEVVDFGTDTFDSCDYPDYALPAAEAVASGKCEKGIVICTTGIGVCIVANKVPGVRCAYCVDNFCAQLTRQHNNSNMLALGEKVVSKDCALEIVDLFLKTEFEGGRHAQRVDKISDIEKKYSK